MSTENNHEQQFQEDVQAGLARVMEDNPGMTPTDALRVVTATMLANNPFVPPQGCPINDLPNEILALIFMTGLRIEEEEESDDEDDEDVIDLADEWVDTDDEGTVDEEVMEDEVGVVETANAGENDKADDIAAGPPLARVSSSDAMDIDFGAEQSSSNAIEHTEEQEEEEGSEPFLSFPILVSHICRHWREVATNTPALWTKLLFKPGYSIERTLACVERSKGHPLDIFFDSTIPDDWEPPEENPEEPKEEREEFKMPLPPSLAVDDIDAIMDILQPHADRWHILEVMTSGYEICYAILRRIANIPSARMLTALQFYHYEDEDELEEFQPASLNTKFLPFHGNIPQLTHLVLWGTHVDWERALPIFSGVKELELAYHAKDVRPSFTVFSGILQSATELESLALCLTGPAGNAQDWGEDLIELPSVTQLILYHHECGYIQELFPYLHVPNVTDLKLDYDSEDFTSFAKVLCKPQKGMKRSILAGLESLKIGGLPCDKKSREQILGQLTNVKELTLNCSGDEEEFFDMLHLLQKTASPSTSDQKVVYCPNLQSIKTTGIDGKQMRKFVEARINGGAPLKAIFMSEEDYVNGKDEKWLRSHVEDMDFFEPSSEEEFSDDDDELVEIVEEDPDEDDEDEDDGDE